MKIFQRVNKEKDKGIGIGLAIVERIIILHGGKIWVESEYEKGSTFYFTISKSILKFKKTNKSTPTE